MNFKSWNKLHTPFTSLYSRSLSLSRLIVASIFHSLFVCRSLPSFRSIFVLLVNCFLVYALVCMCSENINGPRIDCAENFPLFVWTTVGNDNNATDNPMQQKNNNNGGRSRGNKQSWWRTRVLRIVKQFQFQVSLHPQQMKKAYTHSIFCSSCCSLSSWMTKFFRCTSDSTRSLSVLLVVLSRFCGVCAHPPPSPTPPWVGPQRAIIVHAAQTMKMMTDNNCLHTRTHCETKTLSRISNSLRHK